MPMPENPGLMMAMMGPLFGALFGIIQGTFAWGASKIIKKTNKIAERHFTSVEELIDFLPEDEKKCSSF